MKISVWGSELPAWVAAGCLAEAGHQVCFSPRSNSNHQDEPGLSELIEQQLAAGQLLLSSPQVAPLDAQIHWIAMAPEQQPEALALIERISASSEQDTCLVINQSLFSLGGSEQLAEQLSQPGHQLVFLADTLSQGQAVENFKQPASYSIGFANGWALETTQELMKPFFATSKGSHTTLLEAEFAKYASVGMLAMRLGYINQLANLADKSGVDIVKVCQAMGNDPRIGSHYLTPGCGFGGKGFTQGIEQLATMLKHSQRSALLEAVLEENEQHKEAPFRKLWQHFECDLNGLNIAIWGAAFKAGTASIDNSPSLPTIEAILAQRASVQIHDPQALPNLSKRLGPRTNLSLHPDAYSALQGVDALLVLTDWPEYQQLDFKRIKAMMNQPVIIDGRNLYKRADLEAKGISYYAIGR